MERMPQSQPPSSMFLIDLYQAEMEVATEQKMEIDITTPFLYVFKWLLNWVFWVPIDDEIISVVDFVTSIRPTPKKSDYAQNLIIRKHMLYMFADPDYRRALRTCE